MQECLQKCRNNILAIIVLINGWLMLIPASDCCMFSGRAKEEKGKFCAFRLESSIEKIVRMAGKYCILLKRGW